MLTERGPDTVRGADVCFYSHARWPGPRLVSGLPPVPPDLAVEVVSPGNRPGKMQQEDLGIPGGRSSPGLGRLSREPQCASFTARVTSLPSSCSEDEVIENLPELPGFRCPVSDFFV